MTVQKAIDWFWFLVMFAIGTGVLICAGINADRGSYIFALICALVGVLISVRAVSHLLDKELIK